MNEWTDEGCTEDYIGRRDARRCVVSSYRGYLLLMIILVVIGKMWFGSDDDDDNDDNDNDNDDDDSINE